MHTYTYVVFEVSEATYDEIEKKLREAEYLHVFHPSDEHGTVIDLHGLALAKDKSAAPTPMPQLTLRELEKRAITTAFVRHGGKVSLVARELGIGRATLYRRLNDLGLR